MAVRAWQSTKFEFDTDQQSASQDWLVTGTENEAMVLGALMSASPVFYQGLWRMGVNPRHIGGGVWEASVRYVVPETDPTQETLDPADSAPEDPPEDPGENEALGPDYSFSITAGTKKITQSEKLIDKFGRDGEDELIPEHGNAIGVTKDSVEGCDAFYPQFEWSRTVYIAKLTLKYLRTLTDTVATTNKEKFYGFEAGELLFLGTEVGKYVVPESGSGKAFGWPVTFKFAAGVNRENVPVSSSWFEPTTEQTIGGITIPKLKAWEYVWCTYSEQVTGGGRIRVSPKFAYVEQLYRESDFKKNLGI